MKKISVIIPCYNEQENITAMYQRLKKVFSKLNYNYEFIFVDNGSTDGSEIIFELLAKRDKRVVVPILSRNFYRSQGAYTAGLDLSTGDAAVLIDGDLQDPPEMIPKLIKEWEKGYDIVYGIRIKRKESALKRFSYRLFYHIFQKLSYITMPKEAGDFSLLDKKIIRIINLFPEKNRYIRGLRAWVGFKSIGIPYERQARYKGKTSNSLFDNINWALFAIFSFSYAPLRLISLLAFFTVILTGIAIVIYTSLYFLFPGVPRGFQTLLLAILFLGGIQLVCFMIIANYLGIIFEEIKDRPKYLTRKILNRKV